MGGILSLAHRPKQCIAHNIEMIQKQKNTFKPCRAGIQPRITDGWEALKEQIKQCKPNELDHVNCAQLRYSGYEYIGGKLIMVGSVW